MVALFGGLAGILASREDFSTEEHDTGRRWIDGRIIYRKVVDIGALPNATSKNVLHGIVANQFISVSGKAVSGGTVINLPHVDTSNVANQVYVDVQALDITLVTGIDRSGYVGHVVLEYVKAA